MTRLAVVLLVALTPAAASAHCFSIWRYKTPQHCGYVRPAAAVRTEAADDAQAYRAAREQLALLLRWRGIEEYQAMALRGR